MQALIFLGFKAALEQIDFVVSVGFSLFLFLNLIYQRYVVSNELLSILFKLINLIFECNNQLRLIIMRLLLPAFDYILEWLNLDCV